MIRKQHTPIVVTLGVFIAAVFLLSPVVVWGFFSNTQTAPVQKFGAGVLALETVVDKTLYLDAKTQSVAGTLPVSLTENSVASYHSLTVLETSGPAAWCDTLTLAATSANDINASDTLHTFTTNAAEAIGPWELSVSAADIPEALPAGSACEAVVEVEAWQQSMTKATSGFRDTAQFTLTIVLSGTDTASDAGSAGGVVFNELMVRPADDADDPNDQEWIELFNMGNEPVDLSGWVITEINQSQNKERPHQVVAECVSGSLSETMVTLSGGSMVIDPGEWLVLEFCGVASYLAVGGDTVRLYEPTAYDMSTATSTGAPVDEFVYITSTTTANVTWSRVPDGNGTWKEQEATPGATNQLGMNSLSQQRGGDNSDAEGFALQSFGFIESDKQEVDNKDETKEDIEKTPQDSDADENISQAGDGLRQDGVVEGDENSAQSESSDGDTSLPNTEPKNREENQSSKHEGDADSALEGDDKKADMESPLIDEGDDDEKSDSIEEGGTQSDDLRFDDTDSAGDVNDSI